jgi:hypothetical protein
MAHKQNTAEPKVSHHNANVLRMESWSVTRLAVAIRVSEARAGFLKNSKNISSPAAHPVVVMPEIAAVLSWLPTA